MSTEPVITITITEQDVRDIIEDANLGLAIGECPIHDEVTVAIIRNFADGATDSVLEYAENLIKRLGDKHARITIPTA